MPRERISVKKVKEVLRLALAQGRSQREIARATGVGKTTVQDVIARAEAAGIEDWEAIKGDREHKLIEKLFPPTPGEKRPEPNWATIKTELMRKGMTLSLLWIEYSDGLANALRYSQFCRRYRDWEKRLTISMRQDHKAGEKCFVDFSGVKVPFIDKVTGEIRESEIFVGVLGASNYTFVRAVPDQTLSSWIDCHAKMFAFFGGVPEIVVPDNLKSGVTKSCRYEPETNPAYRECAEYYDVAVIPTRTYAPKDKAKVEVGVQIVERWILMRLRKQTFTSVHEINQAISGLLVELNNRTMRRYNKSRKELFDAVEKPALRPLPASEFELSAWKKAKVNIDYHVEVARHYYSVPFKHIGKNVDIRFTRKKIEVFFDGEIIAHHGRSYDEGKHTTIAAHMPPKHVACADWTPERILNWARESGVEVKTLCEKIIASRHHPEQGFRSCLGVLRLGDKYTVPRLKKACELALKKPSPSYKIVKTILQTNQDLKSPTKPAPIVHIAHENIRGAEYFA